MTGPRWDSGQSVHWRSMVEPALTGMASPSGLEALLWQMISALPKEDGGTKPLSKSSGMRHPATSGSGLANWKDGE